MQGGDQRAPLAHRNRRHRFALDDALRSRPTSQDATEKCRELAIRLVSTLVQRVPDSIFELLPYVMSTLMERCAKPLLPSHYHNHHHHRTLPPRSIFNLSPLRSLNPALVCA